MIDTYEYQNPPSVAPLKGDAAHEVAVGPVHAGVIEPGHFRFQCMGEDVYNLQIFLGYQHRGVENAIVQADGNRPRQSALAETCAGDTSIAAATCTPSPLTPPPSPFDQPFAKVSPVSVTPAAFTVRQRDRPSPSIVTVAPAFGRSASAPFSAGTVTGPYVPDGISTTPSFSAASIIATATRSFALPPGLNASTLANTFAAVLFSFSEISTTGVRPSVSSMLFAFIDGTIP